MDDSFAQNFLLPGEHILWTGKPLPGKLFNGGDLFLIPFSLMWCGFAFFWEYNALTVGAPIFMAIFGLPFVAVGLYLVFGRFLHRAWLRKNTAYAVTTKKLLRKQGNKVTAVEIETLPPVTATLFADGSGTLSFSAEEYHYNSRGHRVHAAPVITLENIPNAAEVQRLIEQQREQ